jgi:hypothetical protein
MKVEEQSVATFNMGRKETSVARIQASAKAFEILSSGLYSNAPLAIIRELCANAKDSHIAAGKLDVAFDVQIPNELSPQFSVRDFGVGMTHEFVMTRVNTYFDSTKAESNDEIGGFGLGIKSVFSYTTSFMIATYLDGMRRVYVYQIGETGWPEISLMAETATTEANGVEVSVPVKEEDYRKFHNAAQRTFAFYEVKPNVTGGSVTIPEFEIPLEGAKWFMANNTPVFDRELYVLMGGIAYPVESKYHNLYSYSRSHTVFFKADIGEVDITPNREQLKVTERTRKFIKDMLETVRQEMEALIQEKMDASKFTNYWDMVTYLSSFNNRTTKDLGCDLRKIKFNGKAYTEDNFTVRKQPSMVRSDPNDPQSALVRGTMEANMVDGMQSYNNWSLNHNGRVTKRDRGYHDGATMRVDRLNKPSPIVVLEDRQAAHVGRWMRAGNVRNITVIYADAGKAAAVTLAVKALLEDCPTVYNAADLTYDPSLFKTAGAGEKRLYIYHSNQRDAVSRSEVDMGSLPETMYYYATDGRQNGEYYGREIDFKKQDSYIRTAVKWLGCNVYYLTGAMIKKIEKARPDIELVLAADKLNELLDEKINAAAANYFSNDLESIQKPFVRGYSSSWRVDSALTFWSKTFGLTGYAAAKETLRKATKDNDLENMCKLIKQKTLHEMFAELQAPVKTVSVPEFEQLVAKIPFIYSFVEYYSAQEMIDHISATMGWPVKDSSEIVADPEDCD